MITIEGTLIATEVDEPTAPPRPVHWRWTPDQPLLIELNIAPGTTWTISRELVIQGGRTLPYPDPDPDDTIQVVHSGRHVLLTLTGADPDYEDLDCTIALRFARDEVDALLAGMERMVPVDEAVPEHVIDRMIAELTP